MSLLAWVDSKLNRKFLLGNVAGLLISSLVFLVLYLGMYEEQIAGERSNAANQVSQILETSLENAMLNQDLDGLRHIVDRLGEQSEIGNVMILSPLGEVRFSSTRPLLNRHFDTEHDATCRSCHALEELPRSAFLQNEAGEHVLRSVKLIRNKPQCAACHGTVDEHPYNGILIVDYDAQPIQAKATHTTLALIAAGLCVLAIVITGGAWFMNRFVLVPVNKLHRTSRALSEGRLQSRVDIPGRDEFAELGECFNHMAQSLEKSLAELREKEEFLQGLVDAVPDGLRVIDENYHIVLANRAYYQQLGLDGENRPASTCYASSHGRSEPCAPTLVSCPLYELRRSNEPVNSVHQHRRSDGGSMEVEVYAAPMEVRRDGMVRRYVVESVRDLDTAVQYSHEQKLSEIGRLAAGVAHEIYNPLTSEKMLLSSLQTLRDPQDKHYDEVGKCLHLVHKEIDRCVDITGRLLKLSTHSGTQVQIVNMNQAVSETFSLLQGEATQLGVSAVQRLDPSNPRILAREGDFRMVVLNLVQNAFHAMGAGGRLTLTTERADGRILLSVEDTGVGIADNDRRRIFDPFFSRRADGVRGTGLGLAISRASVERDGGTIGVSSELGKGSIFTVSYPDPEV